MKAQLSMEFLIGFAMALTVVSMLSIGLFQLGDKTQILKNTISKQMRLEEYSRLYEVKLSSSGHYWKEIPETGPDSKYGNPANGIFSQDYNGGILVAKTWIRPDDQLINGRNRPEPL